MSNNINSISSDFRDFLLNRNIITDTIENNGLISLLQGIGFHGEIGNPPESVQPSEDIMVNGDFHRDLNIINNKIQSDEYQSIDMNLIPGNSELSSVITNSEEYQGLNTINNIYSPTNNVYENYSVYDNTFNTSINQRESYLDEYGELNVGGPSTTGVDLLGSLFNGNGIGINQSNNLVPGFDVRNSLAGRVLTSRGIINDTKLGQISIGFLGNAISNNIAFNIQQETVGQINLNPLSLINGSSIITPNYNITVAKGGLGVAIDLIERMTGFETPVSLLENESSIFQSESGDISSNARNNSLIKNSGKGQVLALFSNLNANSDTNLIGKRNGYVPNYEDDRTERGFNKEPLNRGTEYINTSDNSLSANPYGLNDTNLFNSEFDEVNIDPTDRNSSDFIWFDDKLNPKLSTDPESHIVFKNKKSILYKTQELFKTNKIKTLTTGHGVGQTYPTQTESSVRKGFISKGSGVLSEDALNGKHEVNDASTVFCRTWTTHDRYDQIQDLQKNTGIDALTRQNGETYPESVLGDNGMVRIGPYKGESIKKFMFSIENLAWADNGALSKLLPSEIGEGDLLSGKKGRIMWFPPYEMSFNETTSVNWDKNTFIGRGEPIYTYNNTERTGTLSWKIIIDHPNYMNFMDGMSEDEITSYFAGCLKSKEIRQKIMSKQEIDEVEKSENVKQVEMVDNESIQPLDFNIYFSNDNSELPTLYENGLMNDSDTPNEEINYTEAPRGVVYDDNSSNSGSTTTNVNYGLKWTLGEGTVGSKGRKYEDNTNFGLNGQSQIINIEGNELKGWMDENFKTSLQTYLKNKCKSCRIKINGYASNPGDSDSNLILSKNRANTIKKWLMDEVIPKDDELRDKRVVVEVTGNGEISDDNCDGSKVDSKNCKSSRTTRVNIDYDPTLVENKLENDNPNNIFIKTDDKGIYIPVSRFYNESDYFTKLEHESDMVMNDLTTRIKHFHPAFHSITPEGFNSRLTFLQQCTRQGSTDSGNNPNNMVFGRPPVCILRLGDFYHTKIIIDSLTFDYEPLVWDLNPEGVGVQPMIVTVNMSFAFIGGSSLNSPINKLQNAISFNYFANTEMYDPRSQKVKVNGELVNGTFPSKDNKLEESSEKRGLNNNNIDLVIDQEEIYRINNVYRK